VSPWVWVYCLLFGCAVLYVWIKLTEPVLNRIGRWVRWRIALRLSGGNREKARKLLRTVYKEEP